MAFRGSKTPLHDDLKNRVAIVSSSLGGCCCKIWDKIICCKNCKCNNCCKNCSCCKTIVMMDEIVELVTKSGQEKANILACAQTSVVTKKLLFNEWYSLKLFIKLFNIFILMGMAFILTAIHYFPVVEGIWWSACTYQDTGKHDVGCAIYIHSWMIPLVTFSITLNIIIIVKLDFFDSVSNWQIYLFIHLIVLMVLGIFECVFTWLYFVFQWNAAQKWITFLATILLLIAVMWNAFIVTKISSFVAYVNTASTKYSYPTTESDIQYLINLAKQINYKIRVVGSEHSIDNNIYDDKNEKCIYIKLDKYNRVLQFNKEKRTIKVEAGINLGWNDGGRYCNNNETWQHNLTNYLNDNECALPDLGGIIKQTVAGFLSNGCAGGNLEYDLYESIEQITLIDSNSNIHIFNNPHNENNNNDEFYGVLISMGLCGIISTITFKCIPSFNIVGTQITYSVKEFKTNTFIEEKKNETDEIEIPDCTGKHLKMFADNNDPYSLFNFFTNQDNKSNRNTYSRFFLWPQVGYNETGQFNSDNVEIVMWKARKIDTKNVNFQTLPSKYKDFFTLDGSMTTPKNYHEVSQYLNGIMEQAAAGALYEYWNKEQYPWNTANVRFSKYIIDKLAYDANTCIAFGGPWHQNIPMDQSMLEIFFPNSFTEIWFDIKDMDKVMKCLKNYWSEDNGYNKMGIMQWEIYCAKSSKFWLSQGYNRDSFRVDIILYKSKNCPNDPYEFCNQFWKYLCDGNKYEGEKSFRFHWGKYKPNGNEQFPNHHYKTWSEYNAAQYVKWNDFLNLRNKLDPHNLFVTKYWSEFFNIPYDIPNRPHNNKQHKCNFKIFKQICDLLCDLLCCFNKKEQEIQRYLTDIMNEKQKETQDNHKMDEDSSEDDNNNKNNNDYKQSLLKVNQSL